MQHVPMPNLPAPVLFFMQRFAETTGVPLDACVRTIAGMQYDDYRNLRALCTAWPDPTFGAAVALYYGISVTPARNMAPHIGGLTAFVEQVRG